MLNLFKINFIWKLKRFLASSITLIERMSPLTYGELIIKDAPLLHHKIFENVEKIIKPGVVKYFILNKETLSFIVDALNSSEFSSLFNRMGVMKPVVSYVTYYQTEHLKDPAISVYANHWHTDDTLRPNAVKFFQLPCELDESNGPLEILNRKDTLRNWKESFIRGHIQPNKNAIPLKFMTAQNGLLANTNKCMHRAGVPEKGKARRMLMIQINDGAGKCNLDQLYQRQLTTEPTLLKNLLSFK